MSYIGTLRGRTSQLTTFGRPWQLLTTGTKFLQVLSGFGIFMAPATGIMLADYLVVRRQKLKLNDLYIGDASSIYWYQGGLNWRAPVVFIMAMWPFIRQFRMPH